MRKKAIKREKKHRKTRSKVKMIENRKKAKKRNQSGKTVSFYTSNKKRVPRFLYHRLSHLTTTPKTQKKDY